MQEFIAVVDSNIGREPGESVDLENFADIYGSKPRCYTSACRSNPGRYEERLARYESNLSRLDSLVDYMSSLCNNFNVNLNFVGLIDTVPHHGLIQGNDIDNLKLGIPESATYVAHAVAVNEHRDGFAAVSIHDASSENADPSRVEKGFVGAHSDIGGGYGEGDLSDVAFMWMIQQAKKAGVKINNNIITQEDASTGKQRWDVVTNPILHDSVDVCPLWPVCFAGPDREFKYLEGDKVNQKDFSNGGMNWATSQQYVDTSLMVVKTNCDKVIQGKCFTEDFEFNLVEESCELVKDDKCYIKGKDFGGDKTLVGMVGTSGDTYQKWLKEHYQLDVNITQDDHNKWLHINKDQYDSNLSFAEKFTYITGGLTIEQAMAKYIEAGGSASFEIAGQPRVFDAVMVEALFTDEAFLRSMEISHQTIITDLSKILNNALPEDIVQATAQGYEAKFSTLLHDNVTYISPDGHRVVVFDKETKKQTTDPDDVGTFDFFPD